MQPESINNPQAITGTEAEVAPEVAPDASRSPEPEAEATISFEQQLAQAEQRGYLRGRNEAIALHLSAPGLYQEQPAPQSTAPVSFLEHPPRSIWND